MAERIDTSDFVEVISEDGDERCIIHKHNIAYIDCIDDRGCCLNFIDGADTLSLDIQQMNQLFESINGYT